ncbi:hypothetical protein SDC9_129127 [bioreactor metagenome]|uniref:Uncharacterized protein n=1 Tax=bioreactor metagenome TaxID=1076179 RepID=A0A645CYS6_9ZZZZ
MYQQRKGTDLHADYVVFQETRYHVGMNDIDRNQTVPVHVVENHGIGIRIIFFAAYPHNGHSQFPETIPHDMRVETHHLVLPRLRIRGYGDYHLGSTVIFVKVRACVSGKYFPLFAYALRQKSEVLFLGKNIHSEILEKDPHYHLASN